MKPFKFKNFSLQQQENVFKIGTDGVLLGALCCVNNSQNILEVGTGTGIISLMLAQRNKEAKITAIDVNKDAAELASYNFSISPFAQRLSAVAVNFKNFRQSEKYDLIVSNPPYFEENNSRKHVLARQQTELNFKDLISQSVLHLAENGLFSVIIPFESGPVFTKICQENSLFLIRKVTVYGMAGSKPKRLVLEFTFSRSNLTEETLIIEKSPRKYSDQYLELTKEFHVF